MPNLQEAINADLSTYTRVENIAQANAPTPNVDLQPGRSSMMRCPLPLLSAATPDALRSFYLSGQVPQVRLLAQQPIVLGSAASTSTVNVSSSSSSSSSSGTTPTLAAAQATVTSAVIGPGATFAGIITLGKTFQLLSITVSSPARVQLYGTSVARTNDLSRGLDVAPAAGTAQNIICDVVLDTSPYQWTFQNRMGANADSTRTSTIYVTLTNLDVTSDAITLTVAYVPIVS